MRVAKITSGAVASERCKRNADNASERNLFRLFVAGCGAVFRHDVEVEVYSVFDVERREAEPLPAMPSHR